MAELDDLDRQIIDVLREDARLSARAGARRLGVAAGTIGQRVARLEDSGVIRGYTVVIEEALVGRPLGFIVGMLMLAVGAARQGAVPAPAAAVLGLAVLMVGTETAIVSNAYFIAGAVVFLVGGALVALALLRMSDEQFAQGSV